MANLIQLFEDYYTNQLYAPDKIDIDEFSIENIKNDFVISRNINGDILSTYNDNIWDLKSYRSNPSQHGVINFKTRINKEHIFEAKKLMFLLIIFGTGKNDSQYSVETLLHYFDDGIKLLSDFAALLNISIFDIIESDKLLIKYIEDLCTNRGKIQQLSSILVFLDKQDNKITGINYKRNDKVFSLINKKRKHFMDKINQTEIIPSRILFESIKHRWIQIEEIEHNFSNLICFFDKFIESERFAASLTMIKISKWNCNKTILWSDAVHNYNLDELFNKYNIKGRRYFQGFITKILGTCKHLIHMYTGMRNGEVLNMRNNCLEILKNENNVCLIVSSTSKLEGKNVLSKWIAPKEIERIIFVLNSFNEIVSKYHNFNLKDMPLFISGEYFVEKNKVKSNDYIKVKRKFEKRDELKFDYSLLTITKKDKQEIEEIDFNKRIRNLKIGDCWEFKTHQYRRSLVVYSIQSGLVSLGALQIQLKHLFREMTLYYANGASYAKKLFDVPKEHIANDFDKMKPELDTLAYIKNVIFSDEKLFGIHGSFIENNLKKNNQKFRTHFFENIDKTLKQFENGDISYKETALGGCIAIEACDNRLVRSFTSCFNCQGGVLKKSKIENVIKQQKQFITFLEPNSIEYRTEVDDLEKLINLKNKFIKE